MARIRTIKPEFFTSEDIVSLPAFARLLYIALWCEADREGRFAWKPKTFKIRYFPADNVVITELCSELIESGLVVLYGDGLAYIPKFSRHQHVNPRESKSELPDPTAPNLRVIHASPPVTDTQVGREGREGKEHASSTHEKSFEEFWKIYPKKKAKGDAEKFWLKMKPNEHLVDEILQAVQRATTSVSWLKNGGEFIPYPATWLNQKGWLDETVKLYANPWDMP